MIPILESVQKADQPRRLGRRQDVPFDQDVLDLVHLGERRLFHLFQSADFTRIGLAGEEDGSVASLADLYQQCRTRRVRNARTARWRQTIGSKLTCAMILN
jgi:hypothetical protein